MTEATIRSTAGQDPTVRYGEKTAKIVLKNGQTAVLMDDLSLGRDFGCQDER